MTNTSFISLRRFVVLRRQFDPGVLVPVLLVVLSGCAALSNPTADAIPVCQVPEELLGKPREEQKTIPLTLLKRKQPAEYELQPGDILGVWIEGVLGELNQAPPVQIPLDNFPPSLGYPVPVREDGTLNLPLVDAIKVEGLTLAQAQKEIRKSYTVAQKILNPDAARIIVTLQRPRHYEILVIREDSGTLSLDESGVIGGARRGTGSLVTLPAYKNDVLNALAQTGGLPGLDATNEVFILRNRIDAPGSLHWSGVYVDPKVRDHLHGMFPNAEGPIIRLPLRLRHDEGVPFGPQDVILYDGDIVYIRARDTELFYTGGLLRSGEFVLPRDYDLDVLEAVARVSGPLVSGGIGQNNFTGQIVNVGLGNPSPSQLTVIRQIKRGGQIPIRVDLNRALVDSRERILVQPGDFLILQETMGEAWTRYWTTSIRYTLFGFFIRAGDVDGTTSVTGP